MGAPRFALYFAPAVNHPLWEAGCNWLQRDAARPERRWTPPARPWTAAPRRYGFHATLKAPFQLRDGVAEEDLLTAALAFARGQPAFDMPRLEVGMLANFLALRPVHPPAASHPLRRLADACVERFEPMRASSAPADAARRYPDALSERQRELLGLWGYPYVFEQWRFHMTLSDGFDDPKRPEAQALAEQARAHFQAALASPLRCTDLAIFIEPVPGEPFHLAHRLPFGS